LLVANGIGAKPSLRFNGDGQFMHLAGQVLASSEFSIFAVATHRGTSGGAREVFSNWHFRGRSTTSVFLGTRGPTGIRFSDAFSQAGELTNPSEPFVLSAITSSTESTTFQGRHKLATSGALAERDLTAPYVIGTQGNYGTEWWQGDIAEILVYDQALDQPDRESVWRYLETRYAVKTDPPPDPELLALASLCHVLLNTNEFLYVD
jgi:hypothetical protein